MIRLFLEGKETRFIEYLIRTHWEETELHQTETISTEGWTKLPFLDNQFKENTDAGGTNLVIFDADSPQNGGGLLSRKRELEAIQAQLGIKFELFLFPDNRLDGDFESLLEGIINPAHIGLLTCFSSYESCLHQLNTVQNKPLYQIPMRKAKIYSFIDAFPKNNAEESRMKKGDWFFDDEKYWNFDSPALVPLIDFLSGHLVV